MYKKALPSTRVFNSFWKAIEEFEKYELLEKQEQETIRNAINKIPIEEDGESIKRYVNMKYGEDAKKIIKIASRIIKLKRKDQDKQDKEDEKSFSDKINQASKSFQADYVDFAEGFWEVQPFYYDPSKSWWLWNFELCCWDMIDETDLLNSIYEATLENGMRVTSSSIKSEITTALKMVGRRHKPKDVKKEWVQFGKKIYDYDTKEELTSTPEYFNCNPIKWEVGDSEDTPKIDKLFGEWVGEDHILTLKETLALAIVQHYPLHRIIFLFGSGLNGKGIFLKFIKRLVENRNITSSNLNRLTKSNFEMAQLYKKLVCLIGETDFGILKDTSILKGLTGEDELPAEFKNKNPFNFMNYATIFIAGNSIPITLDKTKGFYRRPLIINFPTTFEEGEDPLKNIPDVEYNNLCKTLINILPKLIKRGLFDKDGDIEQRTQKYEEKSNPLKSFIEENYIKDVSSEVEYPDFCNKFKEYCGNKGFRELSQKAISWGLIDLGLETDRIDVKFGEKYKKIRYVIGISTSSTPSTPKSTSFPYTEDEVETPVEGVEGVDDKVNVEGKPNLFSNIIKKEEELSLPNQEIEEKITKLLEIPGSELFIETFIESVGDHNRKTVDKVIENLKRDGCVYEPPGKQGWIKWI